MFGGSLADTTADIVHLGLDIESDTDNAISIGNGIVDNIGYDGFGLGQFIYVYHGKGVYFIYGHLDRIDVKLGQILRTGEVVGRIGNTGVSIKKGLHFAICISPLGPKVSKGRKYFNPLLFSMKSAKWQ